MNLPDKIESFSVNYILLFMFIYVYTYIYFNVNYTDNNDGLFNYIIMNSFITKMEHFRKKKNWNKENYYS